MSDKVIKVTLSARGIDNALREIREYKQSLTEKTERLRTEVGVRISELAQSGFNGAVVDDLTGENATPKLANVSVTSSDDGDMTVVIANGEDAVWVEFGAGVYHNGSVGSSPHPKGASHGFTIGGYGDGHGKQKTWGYYEDGELRLTHGTPATMPMYQATLAVCDELANIAKEVFG